MASTRPPGTEDIFPDRIAPRERIERIARDHFARYNFREIITPVMEFTELFSRGIGDETDIVSKEMFTLEDRGGRSLTLRPEGTASVVRAYVENGDFNRLSVCKLFYIGPMFRAERPQKGRLRQFTQFGAELFGEENPWYDFETIAMMDGITRELGISGYELLINSIGCAECRPAYITQLRAYYTEHRASLCEDCQRRLEKNPLRLLDCKKEGCAALKTDSPRVIDFICSTCRTHHDGLKGHLDTAKISYREDPYLVRGLDYYTRTTYEFVTTALGGQNAFAAGGRYNSLVETLGGNPTPAVGFAAGIERLAILTEANAPAPRPLDAFIIYSGDAARDQAFALAQELRTRGITVDIDPTGKGMKSQLKKMDREQARFAVIIGEEESATGNYAVKNSSTREQITAEKSAVADMIIKGL